MGGRMTEMFGWMDMEPTEEHDAVQCFGSFSIHREDRDAKNAIRRERRKDKAGQGDTPP